MRFLEGQGLETAHDVLKAPVVDASRAPVGRRWHCAATVRVGTRPHRDVVVASMRVRERVPMAAVVTTRVVVDPAEGRVVATAGVGAGALIDGPATSRGPAAGVITVPPVVVVPAATRGGKVLAMRGAELAKPTVLGLRLGVHPPAPAGVVGTPAAIAAATRATA